MPDHIHTTIDFDHFKNSAPGRQVCLLLKKGKPTPEQFVAQVLDTIRAIVPALEEDTKYSTEDLCDPELWEVWRTGLRRSAGMCLRYLVETGALPLAVVSPAGKYPLRFRMKTAD